jgi:nucleoside 2-deoxyribosyltransferase
MRIYLAADLFTPFDRNRNLEVADRLKAAGHTVFLPQLLRTDDGQRPVAADIFKGCVEGVDECDVVVGLVDGSDVDSGTAWELGYSYAKDKPVIALRTDYRSAEHGPVNIMIEFGADQLVRSTEPLDSPLSALDRLIEVLRAYDGRRTGDGRS